MHQTSLPHFLTLLFGLLISLVSAQTIDNGGSTFTTQAILTGLLLMLIGFILLFFGYRLLKPMLFLTGLFLFTVIGYTILVKVEPSGGYANRDWVLLLGSLAIGLLGALLSILIFRVGLFFMGALAGLFLAVFLLSLKSGGLIPSEGGQTAFMVILAVIGGVAIQFFVKPLVIVFSSFNGAYSIVQGIDVFARTGFTDATRSFLRSAQYSMSYTWDITWQMGLLLGTVVILFVVGVIAQFRMNRGRPDYKL